MASFFIIGEKKTRPGVYFRYENYGTPPIAGVDDGKCAAVFRSNWGPIGQAMVLEQSEDIAKKYGDGGESGTIAVPMEQFKGGARLVYALRIGTGGAQGIYNIEDEQAENVLRLILKYPGSRKLALTIRPTLADENTSELLVIEGTEQLEKLTYRKDPDILDEKTRGAGNDNYTKYGRDMHKIYPVVMDFPAAWCDCFVDWCFYKAYGVANAKGLLDGNFDDYTVASAQLYKNKGALDQTPANGAQVFFTKNGQVSGCYHTGLVYQVDNDHFYTVEGNTSGGSSVVANGGGVAKKKYSISAYRGKVLFGHPKYDVQTASSKPGKTMNQIAREVVAGKWGNGTDRKKKLEAAGYNYNKVQKAVNKLLKKGTR